MKRVLVIQKIHDAGVDLLRARSDVGFEQIDDNDQAVLID